MISPQNSFTILFNRDGQFTAYMIRLPKFSSKSLKKLAWFSAIFSWYIEFSKYPVDQIHPCIFYSTCRKKSRLFFIVICSLHIQFSANKLIRLHTHAVQNTEKFPRKDHSCYSIYCCSPLVLVINKQVWNLH